MTLAKFFVDGIGYSSPRHVGIRATKEINMEEDNEGVCAEVSKASGHLAVGLNCPRYRQRRAQTA
jgi:hypothetical protein